MRMIMLFQAVNDMKVLGPTVIARPAGRISPSNMAFVSSQAKAGKELSEAVQIPTERSVDRVGYGSKIEGR